VSRFEEPGAVVPHAGICEGAAGQLAVLPRFNSTHINISYSTFGKYLTASKGEEIKGRRTGRKEILLPVSSSCL
jgi:hypothetical protein